LGNRKPDLRGQLVLGRGKLNRIGVFVAIVVIVFSWGVLVPLSAQDAGGVEGVRTAPEGTAPSPEAGLLLDEAPEGPAFTGTGTSTFSAVLRMVLVLVLVAIFIYIAVFIMKRLLKGIARPRESSNPSLKVLATLHLGSNHFVHVISLGPKEAWLVGAGDGGVRLIAEIADKETVDALLLDASRSAPGPGKFADLLRRLGGGNPEGPGPTPENIRKRRERLRGL
jgi:flagellar biogenesis protein FliO